MRVKKINTKLFWLILLLHTSSAIGQSSVNSYKALVQRYEQHELQLNDFEFKVDSLLTVCDLSGEIGSMVEIARQFAVVHARQNDFTKALKYGRISVSLFEERDITDNDFKDLVPPEILARGGFIETLQVRVLYNFARFYKDNLEFEKAIERFEQIIELGHSPLRTGRAYGEIGACKDRMGDFFNAIRYYQKGISLLEDLGEYRSAANHSINMAITHRNIGTPESMAKSLHALEKADSLHQIYPLRTRNYIGLMNDLANQYVSDPSIYDIEKAMKYYKLSLDTGFATGDSLVIGLAMNNISHVYNLKKSDSALFYAQRGLQYAQRTTTTRTRLFDNISDYYLFRDDPNQALVYSQKALQSILESELDSLEVPDALMLSNTAFKDLTIFFLKKKTDVLIRLFQKTGERDFLTQTIQNVRAADKLIDLIQSVSYENQTKLLWRKAASEVYIRGIYAAHLSDLPEEHFYFVEKNKALLLSEEIARNTTYASLPKGISDRATTLRKTILELENSGGENKQSVPPKSNNDLLFDAKQSYEEYLDSVKREFPNYFKDKLNLKPVPLAQWQQSLKPHETFISFIWNNLNTETEALIGLAVNQDKAISFSIKNTDSLKSRISAYQKLVSRPLQTKAGQARSFEISNALFKQLFPGEEVRKMARSESLIIVPDGPLQGIPFEALVPDEDNQEFLIKGTDVSYLYSVSFLNYNERVNRNASKKLLAYAPVNFDETGLIPLKKTFDELSAIEAQIGGSLRFESDATKSDFLSESSNYRIIHLATHANANENPWIAFSDDKVKLHELYTYRNNAELVTLSACNTLLGEVASGEGVLSLSRGFFYSGAKSVVASLWNVNDQSTSTIMADFYANLKAGQGKSEALNNAKRNYLKTHSLSERSPYYWSSFVLIGDDAHIDLSNNLYPYIIAGLLVILLIFIFMKKKQRM